MESHLVRAAVENRYQSQAAWREVDDYFTEALVQEDEALVGARLSGSNTTMPNAEVAANHGALLDLLVKMSGAKRVLEFGTLAGYSTIWFARAVGDDGFVCTLELEPRNADVARRNFGCAGVLDRIHLMVGPAAASVEALVSSKTEPFDLVFIDADKHSNPSYLEAALALTGPGAVIIIDNVVRNGAVIDADNDDPRVIGTRTATQMIAEHPELEATAIQTVGVKGWDGLIVARRR